MSIKSLTLKPMNLFHHCPGRPQQYGTLSLLVEVMPPKPFVSFVSPKSAEVGIQNITIQHLFKIIVHVHHMRKPSESSSPSTSLPLLRVLVFRWLLLRAHLPLHQDSPKHPWSKCRETMYFFVVEKRGFKLLVAFLEPKYKVPLRHYSSQTVVSELYEAKGSELVQ